MCVCDVCVCVCGVFKAWHVYSIAINIIIIIIIGCRIVNYLLEKSRVVAQVPVYIISYSKTHNTHTQYIWDVYDVLCNMHVCVCVHVCVCMCMCVCVCVCVRMNEWMKGQTWEELSYLLSNDCGRYGWKKARAVSYMLTRLSLFKSGFNNIIIWNVVNVM